MKVLIMSESGDGLGIAQYLIEKVGWDVEIWIKKRKYAQAGLGIVPRAANWKLSAKNADLVLADMVGMGKNIGPQLDAFGVTHMGFNALGDILELDRVRQMAVLKQLGFTLPQSWEMKEPGEIEALAELWEDDTKGFVVKPSGNIATGKTMVCQTKRQLLWAKDQYGSNQELVVQELIEGVEVSTEAWFDGEDWYGFNHTFEEKRLAAGGYGPNTGCMGNVVMLADEHNKLIQELMRLTPFLEKANYRGPIDMNAIVTDSGDIYVLELTARFGYDAIEAFMPMMGEQFGEWLLGIALGQGWQPMFEDSVGCVVRVVAPPYPFSDPDESERYLPVEFPLELKPYLYLTDCRTMRHNSDLLEYGYAASDGVVVKAIATGSREALEQVISKSRRRAERVQMQGAFFRNDIGARVKDAMVRLKRVGVI